MNKKCLLIMSALFLFFLGVTQVWGLSSYVSNIPNGSVFSCTNCHPTGSGPTNQFGKDFASHSHAWGASLAAIDSDGDTFTNGTELQNPNGTWVEGQPAPGNPALVTNPGDAASKPTTTYSISGTVSGAIQAGVTITLTGSSTGSTPTDASGNYSFTGLSNGSYTVTPSKTGYTFSPTSIAVTISGADQTGKNFTATTTGTGCSFWTDVIAKYTDHVSGQATWAEVINCYNEYVAAH